MQEDARSSNTWAPLERLLDEEHRQLVDSSIDVKREVLVGDARLLDAIRQTINSLPEVGIAADDIEVVKIWSICM